MFNIKELLLITLLSSTLASCGDNHKVKLNDDVSLSFIDDGAVSQLSSEKQEHKRLFFKYGSGKTSFFGSEDVISYNVINANSLSSEEKGKYYGVALYSESKEIVYTGLLPKNYYWKTFEGNPDYYISNYTGTYFIDIPSTLDISDVNQFALIDLSTNKVSIVGDIDNINREYVRVEKEEGWNNELTVHRIYGDSAPEQSFDFVLLTEGFTKEELRADSVESLMNSKFGGYAKKYILPLLETEPYKSRKDKINIWVVATPSVDSGVSNPFQNKKVKNVYRSTFGAYCSERSLIVRDQERALKFASKTPFDQILVVVNDETYGGQGSDIATFSMNERAPYLIKHELAHAVGMMADEYKNIADQISQESCEDTLYESYVSHKHKQWGRNSYHEAENYLAPNISNNANLETIKWNSFLTKDSPVVYFNYPKNAIKFDKENMILSGEYKSQFDIENALITNDSSTQQAIMGAIDRVEIDGIVREFEYYNIEKQWFIKLINFPLSKGQEIKLDIYLKKDLMTDKLISYMAYYTSSFHFITMPSRDFSGDIKELGIFQGSGVDLYATFRSSYTNIMRSNILDFDKWQEYAYGLILDNYFKKRENLTESLNTKQDGPQ